MEIAVAMFISLRQCLIALQKLLMMREAARNCAAIRRLVGQQVTEKIIDAVALHTMLMLGWTKEDGQAPPSYADADAAPKDSYNPEITKRTPP
jgi:hypothetical protein